MLTPFPLPTSAKAAHRSSESGLPYHFQSSLAFWIGREWAETDISASSEGPRGKACSTPEPDAEVTFFYRKQQAAGSAAVCSIWRKVGSPQQFAGDAGADNNYSCEEEYKVPVDQAEVTSKVVERDYGETPWLHGCGDMSLEEGTFGLHHLALHCSLDDTPIDSLGALASGCLDVGPILQLSTRNALPCHHWLPSTLAPPQGRLWWGDNPQPIRGYRHTWQSWIPPGMGSPTRSHQPHWTQNHGPSSGCWGETSRSSGFLPPAAGPLWSCWLHQQCSHDGTYLLQRA